MHTDLINFTLSYKIPHRQILRFRSSGISTDFYFLSIIETYRILCFGPCVADKGNMTHMFSKDFY